MAYYVRKIARAKWKLLNDQADDNLKNYKADTIANDLRTQDNKISLWKADSLSKEDIEPVTVVNSLLGDKISTIDLIFIPEDLLSSFTYEQSEGNTIVESCTSLHYDIIQLTVEKHIQFATDVVLKILSCEKNNDFNLPGGQSAQHLVRRISFKEQIELLKKWISQGQIKYEKMTEHQKQNYNDYCHR